MSDSPCLMPARNVLTCVFCGHAYPEGLPPHGAQELYDHIKICKKHPMRQLEIDSRKLRRALVGVVGADSDDDLTAVLSLMERLNYDRDTIHVTHTAAKALRETRHLSYDVRG